MGTMGGVMVLAQATSQKVSSVASAAPPITFDWTINVGHLITILIAVVGVIILFNKLHWRVENIEERLKHFELGLMEFKSDFKELGGQVVRALLSIARLEGKDERPLSEILREEENRNDRGKLPHELPSRKK